MDVVIAATNRLRLLAGWARPAAALAVALAALAVLAPHILPAERYRDALSVEIARWTGREPNFGRIRLRLLPHVGFTVRDFRLANPPGFPGEFLSAAELRLGLAFWPFVLRGEIQPVALDFERPRLVLLADDRRRNNYTFGSPAQPPGGPSSLRFDDVTFTGAEIAWGRLDSAGRVHIAASAAGVSAALGNLVLSPPDLRGWRADAILAGARLTLPAWQGPAVVRNGSAILRDGSLTARFLADLGPAAVVEGRLTIPDVDHPVPSFDLKTADLDLAALLEGVRAAGEDDGPRPRAAAVLAEPVELIAQFHLAADRVRFTPHAAGPFTAGIRLYSDRIEIWPFTLWLYDGWLQATARTDRRQHPQRFSLNLQARNLYLAGILDHFPALRGKLAGAGELDLQAYGSFGAAWPRSLVGTGQFAIRNGRLAGFDLAAAVSPASAAASSAGAPGGTPFVTLAGDLDIRDGRIASRAIRLESPRGTLEMSGAGDLDGALSYAGHLRAAWGPSSASPDPAGAATSWAVPFSLQGSLVEPDFRLGRPVRDDRVSGPPAPRRAFSFPTLFNR